MKYASIKHLACALAAALAFPTAALAATTPVAVWDGDFSPSARTRFSSSGYTLVDYNETHGDNYSSATIDRNNLGMMVKFDFAHVEATVLVKYSGLNYSSSAKRVVFTTTADANHSYNRTGVQLLTTGKLSGIWNNSTTGNNDADWGATDNTLPSEGMMAFKYCATSDDSVGGTFLYHADNGSAFTSTYICGAPGLRGGNIYGIAIGGMHELAEVSGSEAAKGMTITGIAVFNSRLSAEEMNAYVWPNDTLPLTINANTSVSSINEQAGSANGLLLTIADGVTIDLDTTFYATSIKLVSTGSVTLAAKAPPSSAELAKFDCKDVDGALVRTWLTPGVIGFNFNASDDTRNDVSSAYADGQWQTSLSGSGYSTTLMPDGLSRLTWQSWGIWSDGVSASSFICGYLDDNASQSPVITLTGIPYATYDVIIYCSTDSNNFQFSPKEVNGTLYRWDSTMQATVVTQDSYAGWGSSKTSSSAAMGVNAIKIEGLTGRLTIKGGKYSNTTEKKLRGCIAAIQIMPTGETAGDNTLNFDATAGLTLDSAQLATVRTHNGTVHIYGSNGYGATMDYGTTTASFTSHIVFDGGTHTLKYSGGDSTVNLGDNEEQPIFETANGARVNFYQHDLTGWYGSQITATTDIRIGTGTTMAVYPYGTGTTYYRGRYTIEPGATLTSYFSQEVNGGSTLRLHGGAVQGCEQIYVPDSEQESAHAVINGDSTSNGKLHIHNDATVGFGVFVGTNSTLDMDLAITSLNSSAPIGKWGEGTLNLNGDMSGYAGTLTVHEGTVNVATDTTLAAVATETGAILAYSYAAKPTITSYSGDGNVVVDISSLVHAGTIESGSYVIAPSSVPAYRVSVTGLPEDSGFTVEISEDGVVLTDSQAFSPVWTGPSGTWTGSTFNGKEGSTEGLAVTFSQGATPESAVSVTVSGNKSVSSLSFIANNTAYTLTGDRITTTEGITANGTASVVVSNELSIGGALVLNAGSEFTLASETLPLQSGALSGAGKLVLDPGTGNTYTMSTANTGFTGDAVIKSGTVKMGDATSFGPYNGTGSIRVSSGAAIDTFGCLSESGEGATRSTLILDGGAKYTATAETSNVEKFPFSTINLLGDATVDSDYSTGLARKYFDPTVMSLGEYKLTKKGTGTLYLAATAINGTGEIDVQEGALSVKNGYWYNAGNQCSCDNGTIRIGKGASLDLSYYRSTPWQNEQANSPMPVLRVKNIVIDGVVRKTESYNSCYFTVSGYVSGSGSTPMLKLTKGAVFKPTGNGYLRITESLTLPNDTLTVDIGDVDFAAGKSIPLFKVGSAEMLPDIENVILTGGTLPEGWRLMQTADGLGYIIRNLNRQLRLILR